MEVDEAVPIAAIAKKVLEVLASNKKGRSFLGYVLGIAIFLLLLPVIVIFGLFGWMAGDGETLNLRNEIISNLPEENIEIIEQMNTTCDTIQAVFDIKGLTMEDERKAEMIYLSYLVGMERDTDFYNNLAYCFQNTSGSKDVYDLVSEVFAVDIPEEDRAKMDEMYGVTPTRATAETSA